MWTAPGPAALHGWRANACACSGFAHRLVHRGLPQDRRPAGRHLSEARPRPELPGKENSPGGQRGRSRRGHEKAGRYGGHPTGAHHQGASREHPYGLAGHPGPRGCRSAGRDQHQNLAVGRRYHRGRQGVTSVHQDRTDRCAVPLGDRREQAGDLVRASHPVGLGLPVGTGHHRMGAGLGRTASWGRLRGYPGLAAQAGGWACRSSATRGHGSRGAVGSACPSSARPLHRGFAVLAQAPRHARTAGATGPGLVAHPRPPSPEAR
jgi:hypothetical protein